MKTFEISISGVVVLSVSDIWPDGDAPENPTADDVLEVLDGDSVGRILSDWSMEDEFEFSVAQSTREAR